MVNLLRKYNNYNMYLLSKVYNHIMRKYGFGRYTSITLKTNTSFWIINRNSSRTVIVREFREYFPRNWQLWQAQMSPKQDKLLQFPLATHHKCMVGPYFWRYQTLRLPGMDINLKTTWSLPPWLSDSTIRCYASCLKETTIEFYQALNPTLYTNLQGKRFLLKQ